MVIWLIGLSGAGKTTLGQAVVSQARTFLNNIVFIDGDVIRQVFGDDLGHSKEDRYKNAGRISRLCKFLDDQGINVVCAVLSLFHESQDWNRQNLKAYYEVYIDVPFEKLVERDFKGLYKKALSGALKNVVGVDIEFVPPKAPNLIIDNSKSREHLLSYVPTIASKLLEGAAVRTNEGQI